jgi:hypothetical protein
VAAEPTSHRNEAVVGWDEIPTSHSALQLAIFQAAMLGLHPNLLMEIVGQGMMKPLSGVFFVANTDE